MILCLFSKRNMFVRESTETISHEKHSISCIYNRIVFSAKRDIVSYEQTSSLSIVHTNFNTIFTI